MSELRENDLLDLEIAYAHNPDVLNLIRELTRLRDDVAEAVLWLDSDDSPWKKVREALKCIGDEDDSQHRSWNGAGFATALSEADEAFPT